jgi:hypothetical protein
VAVGADHKYVYGPPTELFAVKAMLFVEQGIIVEGEVILTFANVFVVIVITDCVAQPPGKEAVVV